MHDRLQRLQALLREQQQATQAAMVGRDVKVLFEKAGREAGQMIGKSEYLHAVYADAPADVLGQVRAVRIIEDSPNSLKGVLV
jgi:tRNA-2-methylthio-N6-dimethylallyladenosine synthase